MCCIVYRSMKSAKPIMLSVLCFMSCSCNNLNGKSSITFDMALDWAKEKWCHHQDHHFMQRRIVEGCGKIESIPCTHFEKQIDYRFFFHAFHQLFIHTTHKFTPTPTSGQRMLAICGFYCPLLVHLNLFRSWFLFIGSSPCPMSACRLKRIYALYSLD